MNEELNLKEESLENAEYHFGRLNFGDTLAGWFPAVYNGVTEHHMPLRKTGNRILKRSFDLVLSGFVIVFFLSWMIPLFAVLIRLESRGPVFFRQLRSGRDNRAFWCYKFRSMRVNEESDRMQARRDDTRITRVGAFLRKTSLDEFPQFINVFLGEMSVVGPRPHMLIHTELYGEKIEHYMKRLLMKQGLTGWAQVKGFRGETSDIRSMEERVNLDLWYMKNWSIWLDMQIVCLTVMKIFKADGTAF